MTVTTPNMVGIDDKQINNVVTTGIVTDHVLQ